MTSKRRPLQQIRNPAEIALCQFLRSLLNHLLARNMRNSVLLARNLLRERKELGLRDCEGGDEDVLVFAELGLLEEFYECEADGAEIGYLERGVAAVEEGCGFCGGVDAEETDAEALGLVSSCPDTHRRERIT